ncbi:MAG: unsaturated chondroitin disaccharide hydrolase [Candidatus Omnitrophota bacterium]|jgi:unsaturated chondroitin disaccharide hydrolase
MQIDYQLTPADLQSRLDRFWELSGQKVALIRDEYDLGQGTPVYTVKGTYTTRGWTEWTEGFMYGSAVLQFDATGEEEHLAYAKRSTVRKMASHVSHIGVHDHGFNNVSTYGNLLRLMNEGLIPEVEWERNFYELALKISGSVQAARWTPLPEGGYIYSFNGPHSLFVDTIRSCRVLMVSHRLGHSLMGEGDRAISLLGRAIDHIRATARYSVFYGEGRDRFDAWGRTAHECIFNVNDGAFRCPNAQQGFSGFTTWTRGLAWAMVGFAEELECMAQLSEVEFEPFGGRAALTTTMMKAARATCDYYIANTPTDGIPYWDNGAPNLHRLGEVFSEPSNPYNDWEPVDSSAAAIASQGLLRLGHLLGQEGEGKIYWQAGLTTLKHLFDDPYLSQDEHHQGLILHSIYHQPNGWDHVAEGQNVANGESSMWGDYHAREVALYIQRVINGDSYYQFDACVKV